MVLYRFPLIWYPLEGYDHDYELPEGNINDAFARIILKQGFRAYKEEVYLAYSLTQFHLNHLFARGPANR